MTSDPARPEREPVEPVHHPLSWSHFTQLADGGGGAQAVTALRQAEAGRRMLLLRELLGELRAMPRSGTPLAGAAEAWSLLTAAQAREPHLVRSLLATPPVGLWAARLLRRIRRGATTEVPLWADAGHFHALAASAAVLSGLDFRTRVPMRDGQVVLPTLGRAAFSGRDGWDAALVVGTGGRVEITARGTLGTPRAPGTPRLAVQVPEDPLCDAPGWNGSRVLHSVSGRTTLTVRLEALDPHRGLRHWTPSRPLTRAEEDRWRVLLDRAWPLIAAMHRDTAEAMARARLTLVPWPPAIRFRPYSTSAEDGFGGIMLSEPTDATELAVTLVRRFQHLKLNALTAFTPLYDEDGPGGQYYAPWRDDPRPLGGLFRGLYGFFGVTRFWHSRRNTARGAERSLAEFEFALWRHQTWLIAHRLRNSPRLTPAGRRVVASLESRLASWLTERVPEAPLALAEAAVADHTARWRMHHLRPDPDAVSAAARAWLDGRAAPPPPAGDGRIEADPAARDLDSRALLFRRRLSGTPGDAGHVPRLHDVAPAEGPEPPRVWAEFALSLAASAPGPASRLLLERPEWVRAVHRQVRTPGGRRVPPETLARWLAGGRAAAVPPP